MNISKRSYLLAIPLLAVLLFGACSRSPNDPQIISAIQAKLYQQPDLKALPLNVTSENGVVTLSGNVGAPLEKLAVEDLAQKTPGVKQVIDQITVSQSAPSEQALPPASKNPPEEAYAPRTSPRHHHIKQSQAPENDQTADNAENAPPPSDTPPAESQLAQAQQPAAPAAQPVPAPAPPPPPPPQPVHVTIPSGTSVTVRMIDSISSQTAQAGQTYAATLFGPVVVGSRVVIPQGADAKVSVVQVQSAGHYQGQSQLEVELVSVSVNGTDLPVQTGYYTKVGNSRGKNSAEKIGGGAALGALLGAVLGRGRGAGIGAGAGAAAGTIDQTATHGQQVTIPSETKIDFTLKSPVTVTVNPGETGGNESQ